MASGVNRSTASGEAFDSALLFAGRLADLYGRKQLFILGLAVGLLTSVVCGIVPVHLASVYLLRADDAYQNRITLRVLRAISGLGLAIASPAGFGIIGVNFREEPGRTIAFAAPGAGAPIGAGIGKYPWRHNGQCLTVNQSKGSKY